jgi:peptidyl-tRNA hydrolase
MYILILDDIPTGHAVNTAAHASLACYLKFQHSVDMNVWLNSSFKKVSCSVSREQLEKALDLADNHVVLTESALGDRVMGAVFCPRPEWDPFFKTLSLWR